MDKPGSSRNTGKHTDDGRRQSDAPIKNKIKIKDVPKAIEEMKKLPVEQQAQKCREILANLNTHLNKCFSRDDRGENLKIGESLLNEVQKYAREKELGVDLTEERERAWWTSWKY